MKWISASGDRLNMENFITGYPATESLQRAAGAHPRPPRQPVRPADRILLAEPLVDDFRRRFEGVTPDEAEVLAGSFTLDRCARRGPLADVLREHLI
ncbi:hypothetical protein [Nonomuraea sp. SBT364]|uniref:hypothetical protein n=1 Tax=Nonomuraea sp. SBT364 TaxID=1580530 RepID=UPI00066D1152|nr:hypothetical protein [Nonomuraea sp. SBT364]